MIVRVLSTLLETAPSLGARLIRFFKLARYSPGMTTLLDAVCSERRGLMATGIILAGTVLNTASFMHFAEAEAQPDKFGPLPDAMRRAVITPTAVGYGDAGSP